MAETEKIKLTINGKEVQLPVVPGEMLADLLRQRLELTGTKIGCNEAECGTCTVLVNGAPVLSCIYPAQKAHGKTVLTIEGLALRHPEASEPCRGSEASEPCRGSEASEPCRGSEASEPCRGYDEGLASTASVKAKNKTQSVQDLVPGLHPLQEAFIKHGAIQCGFCIPGQIMTAYALLQNNPAPTSTEIRHALKDTLCRCAGYATIEGAVQAAARAIRSGGPITASDVVESAHARQVVGRITQRPEAVEKVTGCALYSDDLSFEGMLYGRAKRAMLPHARLVGLDVVTARQLEGVWAVLTAADIPGEHTHGLVIPDWPSLVGIGETVRYVGDSVALVAAETREIATQALDLIKAEFEPLPVISDPVQALQPEAVKIHPGGNLLKHIKVRKGDVDKGFNQAEVILEHTFHTSSTDHLFMEPECSLARLLPDGRMEIYVGSQIPYADRDQVARALGWPVERVRVVGMLIGGGFGGKEDITAQVHAALLANVTGRPVKILYDRRESLLVHPKRHATQIRVKLGALKDGSLTAVETELYGDTGAYASLGEKVMTRATTHSSGPYEVPSVRADCYAMYTNNPPAGAFRGFGVTQSAFAIESMMDMLAEKLQLNPVALRKKNALHIGSITNTGQVLRESVGLLECLEKVQAEMVNRSLGDPFTSRPVAGAPHLRRAWGFALAYKNTGLGGGAPDKSGAEVELYRDGTVEVRTSSAELGQGLVTVLQMIVAEELGIPLASIRVRLSDTDLTPDGGPTTASRQTYVTGNAARGAAKALRQAIVSTLAEKYDVPPDQIRFIEGLAQVGAAMIPLGRVSADMQAEGRPARVLHEYWAPATRPLGEGGDMHFAFSFAAQAAEVEVNTLTGEVKVLQVIAANDVGSAINPLGLQGQVEGGVMMGLGNALMEAFIVEEGQVFTDRMARYRIPSIVHTPDITSIIVEHPTADGPFGAKGVGEIVSIPTTPAITNAIYHAVGVRIDHLPVDQELICLSPMLT